jgi:hypothetical protein
MRKLQRLLLLTKALCNLRWQRCCNRYLRWQRVLTKAPRAVASRAGGGRDTSEIDMLDHEQPKTVAFEVAFNDWWRSQPSSF